MTKPAKTKAAAPAPKPPQAKIDPPHPHLWFLILSAALVLGWIGFLAYLAFWTS